MKYIGLTIGLTLAVVASTVAAEGVVRVMVDDQYVSEYTTIQEAIDNCPDGGTVEIEPGTYGIEWSLVFPNRSITVTGIDPDNPEVVATTIIQGPFYGGYVCMFVNGEKHDWTLQGLTITEGFESQGGGIYCANASPLIRHCVIKGNGSYGAGAGLFCADAKASPTLENCVFSDNMAYGYGGAIFAFYGSPVIRNSLIVGNYAHTGGAFAFLNATEPVIENCTIVDNIATDLASAVYCEGETFLTIENTVFWGNLTEYGAQTDTVIHATGQTEGVSAWIDFCCIQGGQDMITVDENGLRTINMGQGTIFEDPQFVLDGDFSSGLFMAGDYHLQDSSPCINAGNPDFAAYEDEVDLDGEARVAGGLIDIGVDEVPMPIEADVVFVPRRVYVNLPGKYIYAYIRLEHEQYTIHEIDKKTIVLNDTIKPKHVYTLDNTLLVQFKRDDLLKKKAIQSKALLQLTISGQMNDGAAWSGLGEIQLEKFYWKKWFHGWKWKWFR
ncbi:MAG: right-handed parallel beta-helix repeat-containing protein [Sedimentisphaerales bacterium]|nr:right-handed parallel beta-helix repeat-containing protein [Sedimentisphaerales bacterium]